MNNLPPAKQLLRLSTCETEQNKVDTRKKIYRYNESESRDYSKQPAIIVRDFTPIDVLGFIHVETDQTAWMHILVFYFFV